MQLVGRKIYPTGKRTVCCSHVTVDLFVLTLQGKSLAGIRVDD